MVQIGGHSGTLRAMSESVPANKSKPPGEHPASDQPEPKLRAPGDPMIVPVPAVPVAGAEQQDGRKAAREIGGPQGPEPTRFGDWERKGRCIDF